MRLGEYIVDCNRIFDKLQMMYMNNWLASGMTISEILSDFSELTQEDIYAALSYAADRENKIYQIAV